MTRKRLTERFPFLLPARQLQRKLFFYAGMFFDRNIYAKKQLPTLLAEEIFKDSTLMINRNSGYDIQYQYNKAHNLKLAAKKIHGLLIAPGETFSLCLAIKNADKKEPYLDGLSLVNGRIQGEYGGGLCQLSNLLYWLFLHTPLTVTERHAHGSESIPPVNPDEPAGVDAAIAEGWLDLKVKNNTSHTFQLCITFEDAYMTGTVRCESAKCYDYTVYNPSCRYLLRKGQIYQEAEVSRKCKSLCTGKVTEELLYHNTCLIGYPLPEDTVITVEEDKRNPSAAEPANQATAKPEKSSAVKPEKSGAAKPEKSGAVKAGSSAVKAGSSAVKTAEKNTDNALRQTRQTAEKANPSAV